MVLSDQPSTSVCPLSITRDMPLFISSIRSEIVSETMPIIKAKMSMPPMVMRKATSRPPAPSCSACVPGSATKHQLIQSAAYSAFVSPSTGRYTTAPTTMSTPVIISRNTDLAEA